MKRISFLSFYENALDTLRRFPLTLLLTFACTCISIKLAHQRHQQNFSDQLLEINKVIYLGILLSISVTLFTERLGYSASKKGLSYLLCIALLLLYYFSLTFSTQYINTIRFVLIAIGFHLLVSFSPFIYTGKTPGLWEFNKILFLRILLCFLYSGVIYLGLTLALLALDKLLDVTINGNSYFDLWIVIVSIFNTWFFLAGVPVYKQLVTSYPRGLKIFTVNVLLPLVCIYLVILYLYEFKIIFGAYWPEGWVTYMILSLAFFGILSFLLVYPLKGEENKWVNFFSRLFYFLLLPLVLLLFAAIYKRVSTYGITEERYLVILLASWLLFISMYSIFTHARNIRLIPVSLCILCFLSCFGPWGAFSVSKRSQVNLLTDLLNKNKLLVNGQIQKTIKARVIPPEDMAQVEKKIYYLCNHYGYHCLQSLFAFNLDSMALQENYGNAAADNIMQVIRTGHSGAVTENKIEPEIRQMTEPAQYTEHYFTTKRYTMLSSKSFDYVSDFSFGPDGIPVSYYYIGSDSISFSYNYDKEIFELAYKKFKPLIVDPKLVYQTIFDKPGQEQAMKLLTVNAVNSEWSARIIFTQLTLTKTTEYHAKEMTGEVMVKIK